MDRRLICAMAMAAAILAPAAALAAHGKAGLWTITMSTTTSSRPGGAISSTRQMCVNEDDVYNDRPPRLARNLDCDMRTVRQNASVVIAETICHGRVEGVGRSRILWNGNEHYTGTYNFKGRLRGDPNQTSISYRGDWVKADCGAVRAFIAQPD